MQLTGAVVIIFHTFPPKHLYVIIVALVVFWFFFLILHFFILTRCTVCGCIFRLLVQFKIIVHTLKHTHMAHSDIFFPLHTITLIHTITETCLHVASDKWVDIDEIGRAGCYTNTDQCSASSSCPGLDLFIDACVCERLSFLLSSTSLLLSPSYSLQSVE